MAQPTRRRNITQQSFPVFVRARKIPYFSRNLYFTGTGTVREIRENKNKYGYEGKSRSPDSS